MEEYKGLRIEYKQADELIPYARNARTHSDAQVAQLAASIKEFGFNAPIAIDADNMVLCGHGRLLAAHKLGIAEVPTVCLSHLSETQKRAYVIADNKLALNADWDSEMLKIEIEALNEADFELAALGFDVAELGDLLNVAEPEAEAGEAESAGALTVTITCEDKDEQSALYAELRSRGLQVSMGGGNGQM